jgi:rod shape-determining protein MreD
MIMRPGQQLLLPANPVFIWGSLLAALLLNMVPNMAGLGRAAWMPDMLALVLVFWSVHQPLRVGVGAAFVFGLLLDVHQAALLGQHALSYTALCYFAITIHRRLLWFTVPSQALQVLPLFVAAHAIELTIRMFSGGLFPGWPLLAAPLLEAALWPVVSILLLVPQRRAPNPDANRPL